MKQIFIYIILNITISCNYPKLSQNSESSELQINDTTSIRLILPGSLENRRQEFQGYVNAARINVRNFAEKSGWKDLVKDEFMDSVIIFDNKNNFNRTLLKLAGADTSINLPDTYCAALEKRTLVSVSPEIYSNVYPEGIEENSFEKLLTHEVAHRLHVRILQGDEEAMGPIWFYEGFATYVANQFSESNITLSKDEMIRIMEDPDRGSYIKYNYIFRYFINMISLKELILKAKNENFNKELIKLLE